MKMSTKCARSKDPRSRLPPVSLMAVAAPLFPSVVFIDDRRFEWRAGVDVWCEILPPQNGREEGDVNRIYRRKIKARQAE